MKGDYKKRSQESKIRRVSSKLRNETTVQGKTKGASVHFWGGGRLQEALPRVREEEGFLANSEAKGLTRQDAEASFHFWGSGVHPHVGGGGTRSSRKSPRRRTAYKEPRS